MVWVDCLKPLLRSFNIKNVPTNGTKKIPGDMWFILALDMNFKKYKSCMKNTYVLKNNYKLVC